MEIILKQKLIWDEPIFSLNLRKDCFLDFLES